MSEIDFPIWDKRLLRFLFVDNFPAAITLTGERHLIYYFSIISVWLVINSRP